MTARDDEQGSVNPSEQRGGATPGERETTEKGPWAARADQGVVPPELGGSDAPEEMLPDDPDLGGSVLGETTGSDEPATETGIDPRGGENADATSQSAPKRPPGVEPDLKDAAAGPRQVDLESGA